MLPLVRSQAFGALVLALAALQPACQTAGAHEEKAPPCAECHMPEYRRVKHPVHVDVKPVTCTVCHSQESWRPSRLKHDGWPLDGAHLKAECSYCHSPVRDVPTAKAMLFHGTPKECVGCHREDYDASKFPGHSHFPLTCKDCHSTTSWKPATHKPEREPEVPAATDAGAPPPKPTGKPTPTPTAPKPKPKPTTTPTTPTPPTPTTPPPPPPDVTSHPSRRR